MPWFDYKGLDAQGQTEAGRQEGADAAEVFATLRARGVAVFELTEAGQASRVAWYNRELALGRQGHALGDQATVADLLAMLAQLRLPVTDTLAILAQCAPSPAMARHFDRTTAAVADGRPLAQAFAEAGDGFAPMFHEVLRVADAANTLPQAMADLAQMMRRMEGLRGRIGAALIYPAILVAAAFGLMALIALYLAPTLAPIFTSVNKPLPGTLAALMWLGETLTARGGVVGLGLLGLLAAGPVLLALPVGAGLRRALAQRLPVFGPLLRDVALLRHVTATEMLLRSGMPLADALDAASAGHDQSVHTAAFREAAENLRQGARAIGAFQDRAMPQVFVNLFDVGEQANRLPDTLRTLEQVMEQGIDRRISRAMQLLTPVLTLLIGAMMAFLVYTVMGALLDVNTVAF